MCLVCVHSNEVCICVRPLANYGLFLALPLSLLTHRMWADFEWENKIGVCTNFSNLREFVEHICTVTNMTCMTSLDRCDGADFLAANLYAKSVYGDHVLVNVSVELKAVKEELVIKGHIRIRSKTQAVALSMGDCLSTRQKKQAQAAADDV